MSGRRKIITCAMFSVGTSGNSKQNPRTHDTTQIWATSLYTEIVSIYVSGIILDNESFCQWLKTGPNLLLLFLTLLTPHLFLCVLIEVSQICVVIMGGGCTGPLVPPGVRLLSSGLVRHGTIESAKWTFQYSSELRGGQGQDNYAGLKRFSQGIIFLLSFK